MKIVRAFVAGGAIALAAWLSGCGTTSQAAAPTVSKTVVRERIDWKGASIGAEVPSWVEAAVDNDVAKISRLPQFEGKCIFFGEQQGKNLDLLKSWVENFDVQSRFSRSLSNFVVAKFGGEQSGSKDGERSDYLKELASSCSEAELNGLSRKLDYWVKTRYIDSQKKTTEDIYQYFVVYAIDKTLLKEALDRAMGKVAEKTEQEAEMKREVRDAIIEAQAFAEKK